MIINGNLSWERFIKAAVQTNSSASEPFKHCCNSTGEVCELASEFSQGTDVILDSRIYFGR